jgi:hypothetical protein
VFALAVDVSVTFEEFEANRSDGRKKRGRGGWR